MKRQLLTLLILFGFALGRSASAQEVRPPVDPAAEDRYRLDARLPLLVVPYNFIEGYRAPSMAQSLQVSATFYSLAHFGISELGELIPGDYPWFDRIVTWTAIMAFDLLTSTLPPGTGWLHEEWHRAVLGQQGIDSRNEINEIFTPQKVEGVYAVYGMSDRELADLKADDPANIVRLALAGDEAMDALSHELQTQAFFHGKTGWRWGPLWSSTRRHQALYWLNWVAHFSYIGGVADGELDPVVEELNAIETTPASRDFMGPDFSGYVYDLFRPEEPYEGRGPHSSGTGIDRYIKVEELTDEERAYLRRQRDLHLVNLANPHLLGIEAFVVQDARFNLAAHHGLAPFGYELGVDGLLSLAKLDLEANLRFAVNRELVLPGLDLRLVDLPIMRATFLSPRVALWLQPRDLRFEADRALVGGLVGAELEWRPWSWAGIYGGVDAKTRGYVTGNEALRQNLRASLGVALYLQ